MVIGVLSLQGAVVPHLEKLKSLEVESREVLRPKDLAGLSGIILPGGESTTMIHLLKLHELWEPLVNFLAEHPGWGVCAGTILLAEKVHSPAQVSLGAMPISVERNSYGRQAESFTTTLTPTDWARERGLGATEGVFIRAPRIESLGADTKVLYAQGEDAVMVEDGRHLASTFHPELTTSDSIHRYFARKCSHT